MTYADIIWDEDETVWRDLIEAQASSLASVWNHGEDDFWNDA